ncbi:MAG: APC family permease [Gammaproteobacteria bacterium]
MRVQRILARRHVVALAFGAMVGWSWVLLTGLWIGRAGSLGAVLAFVIAGVAMVLIALTYAELAAAMPQTGGEHVYTARAFGPGLSFLCTWALLFGYVSVVAFEVVALPYALSALLPAIDVGRLWQVGEWPVYASHIAIGIGAALALTAVNVRGIESAARLQGVVTLLIVGAGIMLCTGAVGQGGAPNLEPLFADGVAGILGVVVMVPLMFVGFDVIPQAAEEIDLPPARIGALVVVSVLCAVAWYGAVVLAVGWVLDAPARAAEALPTAAAASRAWGDSRAGVLLICGGIAGIVTTWNAFLVGASRLVHVMAEDGQLPRWLAGGGAAEAGAPRRALWVICGLSCLAPWFGRPALVWLVDAGSVGVIVAYAIVALAFLRLRAREPDMPRPYRVPYGQWVGRAAFVLAVAIGLLYLPWSPSALRWPEEWLVCLTWVVLGFAFHLARQRRA